MQTDDHQGDKTISISRRHVNDYDPESTFDPYRNNSYNNSSYAPEKTLPAPIAQHPHSHSKEHRRFSKGWWKSRDVWPRLTYLVTGIVLCVIWIGVMIAFADQEVRAQQRNKDVASANRGESRTPYQLYLKGTLKKFDPVERALTVSWSACYLHEDNVTISELADSPDTFYPINIYRDVKVVTDTRNITPEHVTELQASGYNLDNGFLRIDNTSVPPIGVLGQHTWDSVDTQIDFSQAVENNSWTQPLFGYPFDVWAGQIVFATTDRAGSEIANLSNTFAFGLDGAVLSDSTLNWRISLTPNNTCLVDGEFEGCELHLSFTGKRPPLVRFAALLAVLVNWLSTIGIFVLTSEAVIMGRMYILTETDILGVCFTALFALPTVRALLPGAPDFGAIIDLIGVIPNIIIISLCTTMMALRKVLTRKPKEE
ncbi:hypothetical protein FRC17_008101 [Serendipita sp. 399]|nr:hypothetical protein FRC17_008101 [Serendipita sp. 399]